MLPYNAGHNFDVVLEDWMPEWYGDGRPLGNGNGNIIFRLREGIERFLITDINNPGASAMAQSEVAVQWDVTATAAASFNHVPGGSNVIYLDGHVEFKKYPNSEFPVVKGMARIFGAFVFETDDD